MKTFKIVSLEIVEKDNIKDIPLEDGLIINKEDGKMTWLIEAYIDKKFYDYFRIAQQQEDGLDVQVVITNEANDPAPFRTHIRCIKSFDKHISVLLEGHLNIKRNEYAELLLKEIIDEGFTGEDIMVEFKNRMRKKNRVYVSKKG